MAFKSDPAIEAYQRQSIADYAERFKQFIERAGLTSSEGRQRIAEAWGGGEVRNEAAVNALVDPYVDDQYKAATLDYKKRLFLHQHFGHPEPVVIEATVEPIVVKPIFELGTWTYQEGDTFTIKTPELGTVEVVATRQAYGTPPMVGLHFGNIKTPLSCLGPDGKTNAHLQFYSSGTGYYNLRLVYTCRCSFDAHNHSLEWQVNILDRQMIAKGIGWFFRQPHNHPLVPEFAHLAPAVVTKSVAKSITKSASIPLQKPVEPAKEMQRDSAKEPVVEPQPEPRPLLSKHQMKADREGQLSLF